MQSIQNDSMRLTLIIRFPCALALLLSLALGCQSAPKNLATEAPATPATPTPNAEGVDLSYQRNIEHPSGMDISDVRSLFRLKIAPKRESLDKCDFDYQAESVLSKNKVELFTTMPAHVKSDPLRYHWCFYHKILQLEDDIDRASYIEEKQTLVMDRYLFLTHLARIFHADMEDPRYLEFAQHNYKRLRTLYFPR